MKYPFEPKSTSQLKQGQYWCFQLCDGRYAAGVVLARVSNKGAVDRRLLWAGLLEWTGPAPAVPAELSNAKVIDRGAIHVRCIQMHGQYLLGEIPRSFDDTPPEIPFTRAATPGWPVWGLSVIRYTAERLWGDKEWVRQQMGPQLAALDRNHRLKKVNIDV